MTTGNWAAERAVIEALESRAYLAAGGLDPSFGSGGKVLTDFSAPVDSEVLAVVALPDGKVLAAGRADTNQTRSSFALTRFLANGDVDTSFGDAGQVVLSFGGNAVATDVVRLADGAIVAAGTVDGRILVARFSSKGLLDRSFGVGGTVLSAERSDFFFERSCVRVQSDGKIIVAAAGGFSGSPSPAIHLMRLNSSGATDASFGKGGSLDLDFGYTDYFGGIEDVNVFSRDHRLNGKTMEIMVHPLFNEEGELVDHDQQNLYGRLWTILEKQATLSLSANF